MARGIDQIQHICPSIILIFHLYGMAFNGDPPFPFKVHIIQYLVLKISFRKGMGHFQQPVSQGAFTMINVGNNTEVPDVIHPTGKFELQR